MHTVVAGRDAMATRFELVLQGESPADLRAAADDAFQEVERLEERWSVFRPSSELSFVNARAATEPVTVAPEFFDLLCAAQALWQQTDGAFDITVGALMGHWGFRPHLSATPVRALTSATEKVGMQHVVLDPAQRTVRFRSQGLQLDLGAMGKGAALDAAAQVLSECGVHRALLHAGTSTVRALGAPQGAEGWEIALLRPEAGRAAVRAAELLGPEAEHALLGRVRLREQSLSVSAIWGRESEATAGGKVGHIMDPRTGKPVSHTWMTAVVTPLAREADALSTALLAGGLAVQDRLHRDRPDLCSLRLVPGKGARGWWVEAQGAWSPEYAQFRPEA